MRRGPALAGLLLAAPLTLAFTASGGRWPGGQATFFVDIPGVSRSGMTWSEAFEDAMAEWNAATAFTFDIVHSYRDPCADYRRNADNPEFPAGGGDGLNGVAFRPDMCGNELGRSVAAVTLSSTSGGLQGFGNLVQTDIIFNSNAEWDVFNGSGPGIDFRRTALHELGHALGLGHETSQLAIMAPRVSQSIDRLQPDDIAGANVLYGGPGDCAIRPLGVGGSVREALSTGDCAVFELYKGGTDTSYVDVYRLSVPRRMELDLRMESGEFDAVLLLTDTRLNLVDWDDDSGGGCDASLSGTVEAGEYLVLANSYDAPYKCSSNRGRYRLSVDSPERQIASRAVSGQQSSALISGSVSADGGASPGESFRADQLLSVNAGIQVDPAHVGQQGNLFVLAILSDGRRYMKTASDQWQRLESGAPMPAWRSGKVLEEREAIVVAAGFKPASIGFTQGEVRVFVGYSVGGSSDIIHNVEAIRFSVN